ncbi:Universal stress protein family protein [Nonomuraea coxensis DSM 45129]|uniref:Universal stress protein family protein n=1 Tax=Nonomuraea coxensis DSM 45129 TaxID=1122611 RepID=A0ABX8TQH4_9ACTN|nr:universal stress protein [Nonomuraea coxensis]QYC37731.1 Universal stress protein family protein [Nonomuraea coxensis DSM 45129]
MEQDLPGGARLIVGVDESPASRWALAWAIGAARLHRMALVAVHVSRAPVHPFPEALPVQHAVRAGEEARCAEVITAAFEDVAGGVPDDLTTAAIGRVGDPGYHLVDLAGEGDLLVLGRGRRGLFSRIFLPSTSMYCARHARTTVVIVQQPAAPDDPELSGDRGRRSWGRRHP